MRKLLALPLSLYVTFSLAQDFGQFNQRVDVTNFRGGEFKLTASVKAELINTRISRAGLWARVDKAKGMAWLDNMHNRPITSTEWFDYSIDGPIDEKAERLLVGGLYIGIGRYYYDHFSLKIRKKDGEWETVNLKNADFESDSLNGWFFGNKESYKPSLIDEPAGKHALLIDNRSKNSGKFIPVNGIDFYYETYGQGDTVLFLHGNSESLRSFNKQIPDFAKQFFVIAMDSRAQGYSSDDGNKITYELMAEDVNSFLEKLQIKKVNVLGWSDGGNIGLILAMKHPDKVKKLATMGANLFNDNTSVEPWVNKLLKKRRAELVARNVPPSDLGLRMTDLLLNEPKINPDDLNSIVCPTLVMAGSKDVIKERHTKLIASKIKKSSLVIFSKGDHYEPSKRPDRFNKTVIDFFKLN